MGFWQGLQQASQMQKEERARKEEIALRKEEREADRKWEADMFERKMLEEKRDRILTFVTSQKEKQDALSTELTTLVNLGLSPASAKALQASGQSSLLIQQYGSKGIDPEYLKDLDATVTSQLKGMDENTVAKALLLGVSTDLDTSNPEESALARTKAVLDATSIEELDNIGYNYYEPTRSSLPSFDINIGAASGLSEAETSSMRKELEGGLSPIFSGSFVTDQYGNRNINPDSPDSPQVAALFNQASRYARSLASGAKASRSPTSAAALVVKQIEAAKRLAPQIPTKTLLENFDSVMEDPVGFAETWKQDQADGPTTVITPGAAARDTEDLGTDLSNAFGNRVEEEFK